MTSTVKVGNTELVVHGDISLSKGGKNSHYFHCDYHEQRRAYGVCLHLIAGRDTTPDSDSERTCVKAMKCGACQAMKMKRLEELAGGAVFYRPQLGTPERPYASGQEPDGNRSVVDRNSDGYRRGWESVGRVLGKEHALPKVEPSISKVGNIASEEKRDKFAMQPSMADAINKKVQEMADDG